MRRTIKYRWYLFRRSLGWIPTPVINEAEYIHTTKGKLPVASLRREVESTNIPCGLVHKIRYYLGDELVREDAHVVIERGAHAQGHIKSLGG